MIKQSVSRELTNALEAGQGILHLAPAWVPRTFQVPGRRLRLTEKDLYALGAHRGGIDERWLASTTQADNGPGTPEDEGLSYVVGPGGDRFPFVEAIATAGAQVIGRRLMDEWGRWPVLCKFFDNKGPLPHHLHQYSEHAARVGREPKPEAYYFPPQLNAVHNDFPYTFFGLEPGTTKEDVCQCLERWSEGDNGVLDLSKAYRLKPGTGWLIPAGILHAPGSLCTYEVQWGSDVFAMFQSMVEGQIVPWEMLVKDVPEDKKYDLDYIISMIDWEANVNPTFKEDHYLEPVSMGDTVSEGYEDKWVIYGRVHGQDLFSAKELTVQAGVKVTVSDNGASGVIVLQGRGQLGVHSVEAPVNIRYGKLTWDEYFITDEVARSGFTVENAGHESLVILRYFGPGASPDLPGVSAHKS